MGKVLYYICKFFIEWDVQPRIVLRDDEDVEIGYSRRRIQVFVQRSLQNMSWRCLGDQKTVYWEGILSLLNKSLSASGTSISNKSIFDKSKVNVKQI